MSVFSYEKDSDDIVMITMDMTGPVNAINDEYGEAMSATLDRLGKEACLTGVIFTSAKDTFFAGGDLNAILAAEKGNEQQFFDTLEKVKADLRVLEQLEVPVVAAINGAALGGGYELALACNHRIAWNNRSVQIGLPEVSLGLLPGGGGIVRLVNLLGLQAALPYLLEGKKVTAERALKVGMIHQVVEDICELVPRAKAWILENQGNSCAAIQPWDKKGYRIPGGTASSPKLADTLLAAPAMLKQKTRGRMPAPERILSCAVEAARLDFDTALRVESRGLIHLMTTPEAKNMISTFFFALNKVNSGASRPTGVEPQETVKVAVLGAGMMGQGIAYVSAKAGIEVILKDMTVEAAEQGKAYTEQLLDKLVGRGRMTTEEKSEILDRIKPTKEDADLQGCDLIIEAVFEDVELKSKVLRNSQGYLAKNGIWASNTSSLPITMLAEAGDRPENFIGLHFFSPVDKMPLLEIIVGEKTSDQTLAKAFDYAQKIKKTPIVVNDGPGFYTTRAFGSVLDEGTCLLADGVHPARVDNVGKDLGMPVGPLTMSDEVSLELGGKLQDTWASLGKTAPMVTDAMALVMDFMLKEAKRGGRHYGGGFFEYDEDGNRQGIWPGVIERFYKPEMSISDDDIADRLLFRPLIQSLQCLEEGILRSEEDGNIGAIMGIGAPIWTGGYLQFVQTYGYGRFIERCNELAEKYGDRFRPPQIAIERALSVA